LQQLCRRIARSIHCGAPADDSCLAWAEGFRPNHSLAWVQRRSVRPLCAGGPDANAQAMDGRRYHRGARAHRVCHCGKRANSNPRRRRAACANAKRHAGRARGRLSRLGSLLSAGDRPPLRALPLLVRSLLLTPRSIPLRLQRPPFGNFWFWRRPLHALLAATRRARSARLSSIEAMKRLHSAPHERN